MLPLLPVVLAARLWVSVIPAPSATVVTVRGSGALAWLVHGLNLLKKKSDFSRNPGFPTVQPLLEGSMALYLLHLPSVPAHSVQELEKAPLPLPKEGESSVWAWRAPRSRSSGRECSCHQHCASWEAQARRQVYSCLVLGNACSPSSRTRPLISQAWNFLCPLGIPATPSLPSARDLDPSIKGLPVCQRHFTHRMGLGTQLPVPYPLALFGSLSLPWSSTPP